MVNNAPLSPDPYRDNEKHVTNFADHLRQKASQEQRDISLVASEEVHRFRDVMFGVNTQYDGHQLRLRDISTGKVINKIKKGAQLKIIPDAFAQTIDDDRNKGNPDEHLWVEVEVDAADTEAGGTGKVRGWVSTEYINALEEPKEIKPEPDPFIEVDRAKKKPEKPGVPDVPEDKKPETPTGVPDVPEDKKPETPTGVPDVPEDKKPETPTGVPDVPPSPSEKVGVPDTPKPGTSDTPELEIKKDDKNNESNPGKKIIDGEDSLDSLNGASGWKSLFAWFSGLWSTETKNTTEQGDLAVKSTNSTSDTSEEKKVVTNPLD